MIYPQGVFKLEISLNPSHNFVAGPLFLPRGVMCLDSRSESGMTMSFRSGMIWVGDDDCCASGMIWVLGMWW